MAFELTPPFLPSFSRREEIERKVHTLANYGGFEEPERVKQLIERGWRLETEVSMAGFVF